MYNTIIKVAVGVLNEKGLLRTRLQDILDSSDISLKEFQIYFKDLEDLLFVIFDQFCKEADDVSADMDQPEVQVIRFYESCICSFQVHQKYGFIFDDFYYLTKENENIKDRYFETLRFRKAQLAHLFQGFVHGGIFNKEPIIGQFENLANQILVISGFWSTHSKVIFGEYKAEYYSSLIFSLLVPYFTAQGLEEYKKIDQSME